MNAFNPNRIKLLLGFFLVLNSIPKVNAQKYGDAGFYLIDSINLDGLSSYDRQLLDSTLTLFHETTDDTVQLGYLEFIVDNCWDPIIWPRYNDYIFSYIRRKVNQEPQDVDEDQYNYFLAGAISNYGYLSDQKGDLVTALLQYQKALSIYSEINNKTGMATSYNNLGVLYGVIGDTAKALEYHKESLSLKRELQDYSGQAMSLNNIGTLYEYSRKPFEALKYYEEAEELCTQIGDKRGLALVSENIGDIYFKEDILGKAMQYYQQGYSLWESIGANEGVANGCNNIAKIYLARGDLKNAEEFGLRSYDLSMKLGYPMEIKNATGTLSQIYKAKGMYKEAYEMLSAFSDMAHILYNDEIQDEVVKKGIVYEYDQIALKDSLENAKLQEIKDAELKEQKAQNFALYIGLSFMSISLIVGLWGYFQKRKDNKLIRQQKMIVESKNKEITDSITYARRIQQAILPSSDFLNLHLKDGFVLYKPKDVVSGDFYWMEPVDEFVIFAVADCTGHGVPGAMVSVVCHNALNRSVLEYGLRKPSEILDKTRELVIRTFEKNNEEVKDGMDIAICTMKKDRSVIEFAGANNSLYTVKDHVVNEIKGDKQPIGIHMNQKPFTNHQLELEKGTMIYLSSDGLPDQFGGSQGKKFKYKQLKELFASSFMKQPSEQKELIEQSFISWKGNLEQVDDVCILGIRL